MATVRQAPRRVEAAPWIRHGAVGGVIAGLVFAVFEMMAPAILMGADAFFMPLRMIGGILIGPRALEPTYPLLWAGLMGMLVHVALSAVFGAIFGALAGAIPAVRRSSTMLMGAATLYGFVLWIVNFYVVAPLFGWTWFPENTNALVQFLAHTLFFGTVLGIYLNGARPRTAGNTV